MSRYAVRRCIGVTLLLAVFACDERPGPLEPTLQPGPATLQLARAGHGKRAKLIRRAKSLKREIVASATITPSGGTLRIEDAGLVVFFPRGAVSEKVVVTATAARGHELVYSFEPHGITFRVPIVIAQELSRSRYSRRHGEETPEVQGGYLDANAVDAAGEATLAEAFPAFYREHRGKTYIVFATTHFSPYALASGRCESNGSYVTLDLP
jgi:hypothetical protein